MASSGLDHVARGAKASRADSGRALARRGTALSMTALGVRATGLMSYLRETAKCFEGGRGALEWCAANFGAGPVLDHTL
jgi:hypothetical protein